MDIRDYRNEIKSRVIYYRKRKNMTQNDLADALNIPRSTYAYYEKRSANIPQSLLIDIAKVLEVSPNVFSDNIEPSVNITPLSNNTSNPIEPFVVTGNEQKLLTMFRNLPDELKNKYTESIKEDFIKYFINE
jgi:transcriptional regulator with XRE-family HTH domain